MILNRLRVRKCALISSLLVCGVAFGAPPITAVGPAESKAATSEKKSLESLKLSVAAPATRIALPAPGAAERGLVKAQNATLAATPKQLAKGSKGRPLAIGYGRSIPAASQRISLHFHGRRCPTERAPRSCKSFHPTPRRSAWR
jgi:hypothetical protein